MKNFSTGRLGGFTLIELLVVVLIIGILAAVALPKYEKSVERARAAEAESVLKSIAAAQDVYMLTSEDGCATYDFSLLDIEVPESKYWKYSLYEYMGPNSYALGAERVGKNYDILYFRGYGPEDGSFYCSGWGDDSTEDCSVFGGKAFNQESTNWSLVKI